MKLPGPRDTARALSAARRVAREGGPAGLRVADLGAPRGWILPSWQPDLEVRTRSGERVRLRPQLPVPLPWVLSYRLARFALGLARRRSG